MNKPCPWCQTPGMHAYRNPHKAARRRLGQVAHLVLLSGMLALLLTQRYLEAGVALCASFALMYRMMCGSYFNDFRVCGKCARIETVPKGISPE